jgi:hypothetical protein
MRNLLLMGLIGLAMPYGAAAQDIYMGTLEAHEGKLVLRRCDLGSTEYRLIDAEDTDGKPVADLLQAPIAQPTSATVLGTYEEDGTDRHALKVLDIQDIEPGKSCHLMDAVSATEAEATRP